MMAAPGEGGVNALNASERVLQCFWDLASVEEGPRLKACQQLVDDVVADQQENKPGADAAQDEDITNSAGNKAAIPKARQLQHALRRCSPVATYVLRRLAKGVGSGRAASRQGYATALASLLTAVKASAGGNTAGAPLVTTSDAVMLLDSCLETSGSAKGGEVRDALLGKLFGLASLVRAGLVRDAASAVPVITALLQLANKKTFMREAAVAVVLEILVSGPAAATDNGVEQTADKKRKRDEAGGGKDESKKAADTPSERWLTDAAVRQLLGGGVASCEALKTFLTCKPGDANAEVLLLALALWPLLPADLSPATPLPPGCPAPPAAWLSSRAGLPLSKVSAQAAALFNPAYLKQILPALQSTTNCAPRLHTLWAYMLPYLLPGFQLPQAKVPGAATPAPVNASDVNAGHLSSFWSTAVEDGLFMSSHERKYLGFQLFMAMLPRLPPGCVSSVFSRNFSATLAKSLQRKDALLHAMARKVMDRVNTFLAAATDPAAKLSVSAALQQLGGLGFQAQAGSKATASLLQGMDEQGILNFCQQHMKAILHGKPAAGNADAVAGNANGHATPSKPGKPAEANGNENADSDGVVVEEEEGADKEAAAARAADKARAESVDQLVAALRFPATTDAIRMQILRFIILCALFNVDASAPAAAPKSSKKGKKGGNAAAAAAEVLPEVQMLRDAAASGAPSISAACREMFAARLVTAATHAPVAPVGKQGQQSKKGPAAKKAKVDGGDAKTKDEQAATADASNPAVVNPVERDPSRLLGPVCDLIKQLHTTHKSGGVSLACGDLPEEADAGLIVLREIEDALRPIVQTAADSKGKERDSAHMGSKLARAKPLLVLVQTLQLHVLGDLANPVDTALIADLRRVAKEAVGLDLPDLDEEMLSDDQVEEGSGDGDNEEAGDKPATPAWPEVLLDVLLSLLSRPAAPLPSLALREACESVWRWCCEDMTPAGMEDLVRVIAGGAAGGSEEEGVLEGDEDEEEDEVEMEVGSDSDDDSDSGSEEEEDEEEEADAATDKVKSAGKEDKDAADEEQQKAKSKKDSDTDSDSDDDSDAPDDAEMFKMDSKIAAYMRAVADKRRNAKEAAAALQALQFRAINLIEIFAKKADNSPLLLTCLLPLTRALISAARVGPRGNAVLAQRIATLIEKTLYKTKPMYDPSVLPLRDADGSDKATLEAGRSLVSCLNRLTFLAARHPDKDCSKMAALSLAVLVRAAGSTEASHGVAVDAFVTMVKDYLGSRKTRLHRDVVEEVMKKAPQLAAAPATIERLAKDAAGAARNANRQAEAVCLLSTALRSGAMHMTAEQVSSQLKPHAGAVGAAIVACAAGAGMSKAQHENAVKACVSVVEVAKKLLAPGRKLAELLGAENIHGVVKAVVTVRDLGVPDKVSTQLTRLVQVMALQDSVANTQPDPALKTKLQKAREQVAAKATDDKSKTSKKQKKDGSKQEKGAKQPGQKQKGDKGSKDKGTQGKKDGKSKDVKASKGKSKTGDNKKGDDNKKRQRDEGDQQQVEGADKAAKAGNQKKADAGQGKKGGKDTKNKKAKSS